jgi:hypothetical protein
MIDFFEEKNTPDTKFDLKVLSLGAGVQSSVMLLMADKGLLDDKPDVAIFADTQWEPKEVYEHLEWLKNQVSIPIHIVSKGSLPKDLLNDKKEGKYSQATIPLHYRYDNGKKGLVMRTCTTYYKIKPIIKKVKEILGIKPKQICKGKINVQMWLGISTDEIQRVRDGFETWITNYYPLIDNNMSRQDCLNWFNENYPNKTLSKSACIGCPFRPVNDWLEMKKNNPEQFEDACKFEDEIKKVWKNGEVFLSGKCVNLRDLEPSSYAVIDFSMLDECQGMCGV